jgi:hypothetical protein
MQNEITAYNPVPSNFSTAEKTDFPTEKPKNIDFYSKPETDDLAWANKHITDDDIPF